jgi:hypothetical protein
LEASKEKSRTNTFQFVPLIQDRIKLVFQRNSKIDPYFDSVEYGIEMVSKTNLQANQLY